MKWVRKGVYLLRKGPREQLLGLLTGLSFAGALVLPKVAKSLELDLLTVPWLRGALFLLAALFFSWMLLRIFRQSLSLPQELSPQAHPVVGTAPFTSVHGELFAQLGRQSQLRQLIDHVKARQTPLVVLLGPSGAGKTSLVEAGLSYELQRLGIRLFYWPAETPNPTTKLLDSVRAQWVNESPAPSSLEELIRPPKGPWVIVLDQMERLSPRHDEPFFELLRKAVAATPPYNVTWVVIIQEEHFASWYKFQVSLGPAFQGRIRTLSLGPFSMTEAEAVVTILLDATGLTIDRRVLRELLADITIDGEILPADIGIYVLVLNDIARRHGLNHFSPEEFRNVQGSLGLKIEYLKNQLELLPEYVREEVKRALAQLVDASTGKARTEGRASEELLSLVKPIEPADFLTALDFLTSSSRLLLKEERADSHSTYRLPPGLSRAALRVIKAQTPATEVFNTTYGIWKANRQEKYLLSGKDLRTVLRHREDLLLQSGDSDKRAFIELSRRHRNRRRAAATAWPLVAVVLASLTWAVGEERRSRHLLESWGLPNDLHEARVETLTLNSAVNRLDWLPGTVKRLSVRSSPLERLHDLPPGLVVLDIAATRVESPEGLPDRMDELDASYTKVSPPQRLPALVRLTLAGPHVRSLVGLPEGLQHLALIDTEIESLQGLPSSLEALILVRSNVVSLDGLPPKLRSLTLKGTRIRSLLGLPRSLVSLTLDRNEELVLPPTLPESLRTLELIETRLPDGRPLVEVLPPGLTSLSISGFEKLAFDRLPRSLTRLSLREAIREDSFAGLERTPTAVASLELDARRLNSLKRLPHHLKDLTLLWYGGTELKDLPPRLTSLSVRFSHLRTLAGTPESVTALDLSGSDVESLQHLPPKLAALKLTTQKIRRLPPLPSTLTALELEGTALTQLGPLPERIERLNVARTQIQTLGRVPKTLKALDISGTGIRDVRGLPLTLRELTLGVNQVKELGRLTGSLKILHFVEVPDTATPLPPAELKP